MARGLRPSHVADRMRWTTASVGIPEVGDQGERGRANEPRLEKHTRWYLPL